MNLRTFEYDHKWIEGEELKTEKRSATFYFNSRVVLELPKLGINGITELAIDLQKGNLATLAKVGWLAHQTACYMKKCELTIESVDDMYDLVSSVGMGTFLPYVSENVVEVMEIEFKGMTDTEKKRLMKLGSQTLKKQLSKQE